MIIIYLMIPKEFGKEFVWPEKIKMTSLSYK